MVMIVAVVIVVVAQSCFDFFASKRDALARSRYYDHHAKFLPLSPQDSELGENSVFNLNGSSLTAEEGKMKHKQVEHPVLYCVWRNQRSERKYLHTGYPIPLIIPN